MDKLSESSNSSCFDKIENSSNSSIYEKTENSDNSSTSKTCGSSVIVNIPNGHDPKIESRIKSYCNGRNGMNLYSPRPGPGQVVAMEEVTCRLKGIKKDTLGKDVLDKVCDTLNLVEKDYFGLRYVDAEKQRHWLDPCKTVYKQLKGVSPCVLCFRVKFYPSDPMKLHEEITRYYLFLQLRRDLHHGRLLCSAADANLLASYVIQSELGDYDERDHPPGYVAEFKMLPSQNAQQEQQIHDLHRTLGGQVPAEAEASFLKKAATLDTFGVDPHKVKDQKGTQMYLGVTHQGIMTFHGSRRTNIYKWSQIKKLAFEGKTFIVHVNINEKHQPIGYKCLTVPACKYLWKCAVEQQFFFTLQNSFHSPKVRSGGSLFSRGSKFRFSGRCQNEAFIASEDIKRQEPQFQRTCSLPNFTRKSDSRLHMRNSANLSESITEDKGGRAYKADTLPRMTTYTAPSVSAESAQKSEARPAAGNSNEKKQDAAYDDNKEKRQSATDIPIGDKKEKRHSSSDMQRPKLVEIARQSSKEVYRYTEVEQKQTVLESERPVVAEMRSEVMSAMKPVEVVASMPTKKHKESAVDVPQSTAHILQSPNVKAPMAYGEDAGLMEQIIPVTSNRVEAAAPPSKQNGGIPIIVTSAYENSREDSNLLYDPNETQYENDEEAKAAKSLEEQVLDLEREFESMKDSNHTGQPVDEKMDVAQSGKTESSPANKAPVAPKKGGCSCGKVLAFTFFSVFVTLTVTACVVMFSDIEHPVMDQLRTHLTFLEPGRDYIIDRYNSFFSN